MSCQRFRCWSGAFSAIGANQELYVPSILSKQHLAKTTHVILCRNVQAPNDFWCSMTGTKDKQHQTTELVGSSVPWGCGIPLWRWTTTWMACWRTGCRSSYSRLLVLPELQEPWVISNRIVFDLEPPPSDNHGCQEFMYFFVMIICHPRLCTVVFCCSTLDKAMAKSGQSEGCIQRWFQRMPTCDIAGGRRTSAGSLGIETRGSPCDRVTKGKLSSKQQDM